MSGDISTGVLEGISASGDLSFEIPVHKSGSGDWCILVPKSE